MLQKGLRGVEVGSASSLIEESGRARAGRYEQLASVQVRPRWRFRELAPGEGEERLMAEGDGPLKGRAEVVKVSVREGQRCRSHSRQWSGVLSWSPSLCV